MYTEQCENNSPPPLSSPLKGEEFKEDCLTLEGEEMKSENPALRGRRL